MHVGNINKGTAAGRLYRVLKLHLGEWMDAFELAMEARTTCLSTRIAEVRGQIKDDGWGDIEHEERVVNGQRKQFYRMVRYASAA